eukprot:Rhum_TRINITY_DN4300_c0_g1::Rhum_TRINITY_DN4300_c0_g1_i1::g.13790::m.13790
MSCRLLGRVPYFFVFFSLPTFFLSFLLASLSVFFLLVFYFFELFCCCLFSSFHIFDFGCFFFFFRNEGVVFFEQIAWSYFQNFFVVAAATPCHFHYSPSCPDVGVDITRFSVSVLWIKCLRLISCCFDSRAMSSNDNASSCAAVSFDGFSFASLDAMNVDGIVAANASACSTIFFACGVASSSSSFVTLWCGTHPITSAGNVGSRRIRATPCTATKPTTPSPHQYPTFNTFTSVPQSCSPPSPASCTKPKYGVFPQFNASFSSFRWMPSRRPMMTHCPGITFTSPTLPSLKTASGTLWSKKSSGHLSFFIPASSRGARTAFFFFAFAFFFSAASAVFGCSASASALASTSPVPMSARGPFAGGTMLVAMLWLKSVTTLTCGPRRWRDVCRCPTQPEQEGHSRSFDVKPGSTSRVMRAARAST